MNPASRIWFLALACCFVFVLIMSIFNPEAGSFLFIALFIVAIASLASLVGFYILFEALRSITTERRIFLPAIFAGVPVIVLINAWLLLCLFDGRLRFNLSGVIEDLLLVAAIPLIGSIIGTFASYKRIYAFFNTANGELNHQS